MIIGLHHAQITIPPAAEDDGRSFYCGVLGLAEVPKPESLEGRGGFWLQVGEQCVHVGVEVDVDRTKTKAHLAYLVSDLGHWRQLLTQRGIELLNCVAIPGFERFEFRDPFGNRIEMIQRSA